MDKLFKISLEDRFIYGIWQGFSNTPKDNSITVIYCPGINAEKSEVHRMGVKLGKLLKENGHSLIRFDYRGLGLSDGHFSEMTNYTKLEDTKEIYHMAKKNSGCNIVFLGFSDGAKIAILAAEKFVKNFVLWSPLLVNPSLETNSNRRIKILKDDFGLPVIPNIGLGFGIKYFKEEKRFQKALLKIKQFQKKTLVIYGEKDEFVRKTRSEWDNYFKEVIEIRGAEHIFSNPDWENIVLKRTLEWVGNLSK
ncbi:alpha/beta hydrolase [Bacillus velezensis]|uniref:alpha/beta hydrolase n=1 Tax=Bacillus velezensis TaxID=492670 RepID=UPI0039B09214